MKIEVEKIFFELALSDKFKPRILNLGLKPFKSISSLQNKFYCFLFESLRTTPSVALTWDVGAVDLDHRIIQEKLNLLHHLASLYSDSLK